MDEFEFYERTVVEYNKLKEQHPDWSEDELYTEAQSIVCNLEASQEDKEEK